MMKTLLGACALMLLAVVATFAFVKGETRIRQVAAQHSLSPEETGAYRACTGDFFGKSLSLKTKTGSTTRLAVPDDVCACHARTMAQLFKPGEYRDHSKVADYLVSPDQPRGVDPAHLKPGAPDGAASFDRLVASAKTCADQFFEQEQKHVAEALSRARQSGQIR